MSKFKEYPHNNALYGKIASELFNSWYIVSGHSNSLITFSERGISLQDYQILLVLILYKKYARSMSLTYPQLNLTCALTCAVFSGKTQISVGVFIFKI